MTKRIKVNISSDDKIYLLPLQLNEIVIGYKNLVANSGI
jgi:hypothetical protein